MSSHSRKICLIKSVRELDMLFHFNTNTFRYKILIAILIIPTALMSTHPEPNFKSRFLLVCKNFFGLSLGGRASASSSAGRFFHLLFMKNFSSS